MNPLAAIEGDGNLAPGHLVAGGDAVWLLAGYSNSGPFRASRSVDDGLTWTVPARWHGSMQSGDDVFEGVTSIESDGGGNWIAGWYSTEPGDGWLSLSAGATLCTAPLVGCKTPVVAGKSKVLLSERKPGRPSFKWKWKAGQATTLADFGDPLTTASSRVCLYDAGDHPLLGGTVPAAGTCGGGPCWRASKSGFSYKSKKPGEAPQGLFKVKLKAGDDGKAQITLGGRGESLPIPTLGVLDLPIRVQMDSSETGACWEATFSTATLDTPLKFKARSD